MNNKRLPISVLMGVYYRHSGIELLQRSVLSILNQTFSDFELLICDDGSTSEVVAYLDETAKCDPRVRLVRRGNLFTLPEKLNACLREASGDLIARMDDDDFSHPERFENQIRYINAHPEIAFVGCNVNLCQNNIIAEQRILPEYPSVQDFYFVQPYIHPSLMFRKEALLKVGGYSEEATCVLCEDYDLLLRLYAAGYQGANLQECLLDYTIPLTAKGNRRMRHRWNETVTRWRRFRELNCLPTALPYVVKPIAVGLLPESILRRLKKLACSLKDSNEVTNGKRS